VSRAEQFPYFDNAGHPGPIAMAHRGGAKFAANIGLENTLAAFQEAVALGYRYLETDVHATADGRLVAFHDTTLDRVTDAGGLVADLAYAAVQEARIGGTEPIPLLTELLEELPTARLNIDIKADGALQPTIDTLRAHNALDRVCVGSFSERRVRAARKALGPRLATAAGPMGTAALRFSPGLLARLLATPAPVLQIPEHHEIQGRQIRVVTPGLLRRAHRTGKQVHVWFHDWATEDAATFHRLLDLGADGIVTDRIDVLRDVLADRGTPL
jgi:glycerophosphoryl diester phosphodiesterase